MPKRMTAEQSELIEARRICVQNLLSKNKMTEAALAREMGLNNANLLYNYRRARSNSLSMKTLIKIFSVLTVYSEEDKKLLGIYVSPKLPTQPNDDCQANVPKAVPSRESELMKQLSELQRENSEQLQLLGKMALKIERLRRAAGVHLSTAN